MTDLHNNATFPHQLKITEPTVIEINAYPLFDKKALFAQLMLTDHPDLLKKIVTLFLTITLVEEKTALQQAYQNKQWQIVQQHAHKLKGSSAYAGAIRLRFACQNLEHYALLDDILLKESLFHQVMNTIKATVPIITQHLLTL